MSDLKALDKKLIENLLVGSPGYVLDFSDKTFQDFVLDSVQIDIEQDKYKDVGTSKAKRLRSFWRQESNAVVGRLLRDLIEYAKAIEFSVDEKLISECSLIAERLLQSCPLSELDEPPSVEAHFEKIQQEIIRHISSAKFIVWAAVAWFTDKEIFDVLVEKKSEGVNVQLVII